jgi:ATP-dependent Clp protease ATP-binding subunit ClpA
MGFVQKPSNVDARLDNKIDSTAVDAARRKFSPEFMNRIDKIVVFRTDMKYGARHLKRAIERHIVFPLADLVATRQVAVGDFIRIDCDSGGRMAFVKEAEGALVPVLLARYGLESSRHVAACTGSKAHAAG